MARIRKGRWGTLGDLKSFHPVGVEGWVADVAGVDYVFTGGQWVDASDVSGAGLTPAQSTAIAKIPALETAIANTDDEITAGVAIAKGDRRTLTIGDVVFQLTRKGGQPATVAATIDVAELNRWKIGAQFPGTSNVFPANALIPIGFRLQHSDNRVLVNKATRQTISTIVVNDWKVDSSVNSLGEGTLYTVGQEIEPGSYRRYDIGGTSVFLNFVGPVARTIVTMTPSEMANWKIEGQEYPSATYPAALVAPKGFEYRRGTAQSSTTYVLKASQLCPAIFDLTQWEPKSDVLTGLDPTAPPTSYADTYGVFPASGALTPNSNGGSGVIPDGTSAFICTDGNWIGTVSLEPVTANSVPVTIKRSSGFGVSVAIANTNLPAPVAIGGGEIIRFIPTAGGWRWVPSLWILPMMSTAYSVAEQFTGDYWTDGRPIFRQVISGTTPNAAGPNTIFSIATAKQIIKADGVITQNGFARTAMMFGVGSGNATHGALIQLWPKPSPATTGFDCIHHNFTTDARWQNNPYVAIVEYVK